MIKRVEEGWTTYEMDLADLKRLARDVSAPDFKGFGEWMAHSPFIEGMDDELHILHFPGGTVDLAGAGCPAKLQRPLLAFLDHTSKERSVGAVLLKIDLSPGEPEPVK